MGLMEKAAGGTSHQVKWSNLMNAVEAVRGFDVNTIRNNESPKARDEVVLPSTRPAQAEEISRTPDPVVSALQEEPAIDSEDAAMLLARSIANRVARRGSDAINAQANIDSRSAQAILT